MPSVPVPPEVDAFLARANPAVVATLRADGSPHTVPTWYDWDAGRVRRSEITSIGGGVCRVRAGQPLDVAGMNGAVVRATHPEANVVQFETVAGATYVLTARK